MPRAHGCAEAVIENLDSPFDLNPFIETIEDINHEYTLEDIQAGKYDYLWQRNSQRYFIGKNIKSKYWFRLKLVWYGQQDIASVLYINNQPNLLVHIGVLLPSAQGAARLVTTGSREFYNSRDISSQQYGFNLLLTSAEPQTIFGWVDHAEAGFPAILPCYLVSETGYASIQNNVSFILVAFYAVMIALWLYNLCLFVTLREPVYGLYILFMACAAFACAMVDGSTHRWLWPQSPLTFAWAASCNGTILAAIYLSFVVRALNGATFWPKFKYLYRTLMGVGLIALLCCLSPLNLIIKAAISQAYAAFIMAITLVLIIAATQKKQPTAGYLLVAEIMTVTGGTSFMLMLQGVVPINMITLWGMHWGFLGESLLLSLAVAARTNIIIQDKLKAQELAYQNERRALEALESSTQIKNQFLTTVSHELRTPLNSIIGFSNVLLDNQRIQGADRDHARTILNNGKQLLAVVNDVLNLSLIDSNRLAITQNLVDLRHMLQGLEVKYRLTAQKNGLHFTVNLDKQLPQTIEIDSEHLSQILKQLLDNAFKFTHQGCVTLQVKTMQRSSRGAAENDLTRLLFTLTDTGIGIAKDKLTQLFQPFSQADSSNTRRYSGTGVGLYIAKSVCEKMGGTLAVDSTVGVGTRFDLTLPTRVCEDPVEQTQIKSAAISGRPTLRGRVLYAEDNLDNQHLVQILVNATGAEVTLALNGIEAVDAVNNAEPPFDLVLMDLQMPEMDGYEATAILKRNGCGVPVIACSASALAEIAVNSEIVFEGYLGKPIDKDKLYVVLTEFLVAS